MQQKTQTYKTKIHSFYAGVQITFLFGRANFYRAIC